MLPKSLFQIKKYKPDIILASNLTTGNLVGEAVLHSNRFKLVFCDNYAVPLLKEKSTGSSIKDLSLYLKIHPIAGMCLIGIFEINWKIYLKQREDYDLHSDWKSNAERALWFCKNYWLNFGFVDLSVKSHYEQELYNFQQYRNLSHSKKLEIQQVFRQSLLTIKF